MAVDEDNSAQDTSVVDPRPAMAPGKEAPKPRNLLIAQPEKMDTSAYRLVAAL